MDGCRRILGVGLGALIGYLSYRPTGNLFDYGRHFSIEVGGVIGLSVGLIVGAIAWTAWIGLRNARVSGGSLQDRGGQ